MTWQGRAQSGYGLSRAQMDRLVALHDLLSEPENRGLTSVPPDQIGEVHILDSLSLLDFPEATHAHSSVDVGSGGGFPGLPLSIARPDLNMTLIEANKRKSAFLSRAVSILGLSNVRVLAMRAEDAARTELRDSFDLALARAVGPLPVVLEFTLPLLGTGGNSLLQRGAREPGDLEAAEIASSLLGGELKRVEAVSPYPGARNLHIWVVAKKTSTPRRFPRRVGVAKKRPLA